MVKLRNNKITHKKTIFFSLRIKIKYYYLSKKEKKDKKETYDNIVKKNNLICK